METEVLQAGKPEDVARAAALLSEGRVVAFPTETVYGLGARADAPDAVAALYCLKRRPGDKRFALLIASPEDALRHGAFGPAARALAGAFWPGPLTLVVPLGSARDKPLDFARDKPLDPSAGLGTSFARDKPEGRGGDVGLRCPDCALTLELLRLVGTAVAAPSANLSGQPPATSAEEVLRVFDGEIAAVLDGGPTRLGAPSTVVRVLEGDIEVLREGAIPERQLRAALGRRGAGHNAG